MDVKFKNRYRVDTIRLPSWDYGSDGWYFITICTKSRKPYFGKLSPQGELEHTLLGDFVVQVWYTIPHFHPFAKLDQFVLMPDHLHGILLFVKDKCKPYKKNQFGPQKQNLASVIRGFKSTVTSFANRHNIDFNWQPRYHEMIIHNEESLIHIREYIESNPIKHAKSK